MLNTVVDTVFPSLSNVSAAYDDEPTPRELGPYDGAVLRNGHALDFTQARLKCTHTRVLPTLPRGCSIRLFLTLRWV